MRARGKSFVEYSKKRTSVASAAAPVEEDAFKEAPVRQEGKHHHHHHKKEPKEPKRNSVTGMYPCAYYYTRDMNEEMTHNDVEHPRTPYFYKPPFRRNFRYFGYPRDLNPDLNTPPRVRSWGPIEDEVPKVKPKRVPYSCKVDKGVDPYWPGRLLKNCTMLENPTLVPVMGKAVKKLGRKPMTLVRPDLDYSDCVSQTYFPLSLSSRKTFCRINKIVKDDQIKKAHEFEIQNPYQKKKSMTSRAVRKSEIKSGRKSKLDSSQPKKRMSQHFSMIDLEKKMDEVFYAKENIPEVMKIFCIPEKYPGKNLQLYGRPTDNDEHVDVKATTSGDDVLVKPDINSVYQQFSVPEDLWGKLAKVRARKEHVQRVLKQKLGKHVKEFKTFTQLKMRNETFSEVKRTFLESLNQNVQTPLPPELYEDNRDKFQPPHNYAENQEMPAQGPFYWKNKPEDPPTEVENEIIDQYIETLKEHHNFSHHLPGLVYVSKHPFQPVELDWFEKGAEMAPALSEKRKSAKTFHDVPYYLANLNDEKFAAEVEAMRKEKAKDLVGPVIYEMYKHHKGIKSPTLSETELEAEEAEDKPLKRKIWVRRIKKKSVEAAEEEEAKGDEEEEGEEEEEEDDEEEEEEEEEMIQIPEDTQDEEALLEKELEIEEEFPLPDVHFSTIEFPTDAIPDTLTDNETQTFKRLLGSLELTEPIRKDEEEPAVSDEDSDSTGSDIDLSEPPPVVGEDPTEHLQTIYQEAMLAKHKSRATIAPKDFKPPELKDVFLQNTYIGDIENLLQGHPNIPIFLQLF